MTSDESHQAHDRREFLKTIIPFGCLSCLFGRSALADSPAGSQPLNPQDHKFKADAGMSYERAFQFAFATWLIPHLKNLAHQVGRDQLIEMLKKSSLTIGEEHGKASAQARPNHDLSTYGNHLESMFTKPGFWSSVVSYDNLQKGEKAVSIHFTECLWAKTFRDANAPDLGYAAACFQDYGSIQGFNPKIKLTRSQTLMQGGDHCDFEWTQEA